uniref:papilin-like isoform X2 n=1 Tax=Myxine glutinosa TaxID=7769 RepID=UPI00358EC26D
MFSTYIMSSLRQVILPLIFALTLTCAHIWPSFNLTLNGNHEIDFCRPVIANFTDRSLSGEKLIRQLINPIGDCPRACCRELGCDSTVEERKSNGDLVCQLWNCGSACNDVTTAGSITRHLKRPRGDLSNNVRQKRSEDGVPKSRLPEACLQPEKVGRCRASFLRWSYHAKDKTCIEFIYGGCKGNENRFETKEKCTSTCIPVADGVVGRLSDKEEEIKGNDTLPFNPGHCLEPVEVGRCNRAYAHWAYNATNSTCQMFMYGGCTGNGNRFPTKMKCSKSCEPQYNAIRKGRLITAKKEEFGYCRMKSDPGPCRAAFIRWFHDPETSTCDNFTYGGCQGNLNNFLTEEQCLHRCGPQMKSISSRISTPKEDFSFCLLPQKEGPCRGAFQRWYHKAETSTCHLFTYGGCRGTKNMFLTEKQCTNKCARQGHFNTLSRAGSIGDERDFCLDPEETGPCRAEFQRWSYNPLNSTCNNFIYGGCRGNSNNFFMEHQCLSICAPIRGGGRERLIGKTDSSYCAKPSATGPCRAHLVRWAYEKGSNACVKFTYGGCAGNGNNFLREQDCVVTCKEDGTTAPKKAGSSGSGKVVGVIFGLLVAVGVVAFIVWRLRRSRYKHRSNPNAQSQSPSAASSAKTNGSSFNDNDHTLYPLIGKQTSV